MPRLHALSIAISGALTAALLPGLASAQTAISLATSGNWSTASNWNPGVVPNNAGAALYNTTVASGRTATLDIDAAVRDLSLAGTATSYATITLNPGHTLTVDGSLRAGLYTRFNGGGTLTLNAGAGANSGSANNAGMLLDNVTFNNQAGSTFSDGAANYAFSTTLAHGSVINNAGTYSLDGAGSGLYAGTGGGAFNNSGTLRGSGSITVPVNSTGSIVAGAKNSSGSASILSFGASGSSSGTLSTGATAYQMTAFTTGSWDFSASSVNSGVGVFRVAGAAVTLNGAHNVTGSTQVGSGSLTFTNANTALSGILYLYGGSTNFSGANTVNQLDLGNPGSASGSPTAVLNLGANGQLTVNAAFNAATYSKVNGTGTASITASGGGTIADNSSMVLNGVTLNNPVGATIKQYNGGGWDATLQNGAVINNAGSWILQTQNGRGWVAGAGAAGVGAAFNNTGTLWGNVSYTSADINFALNNSGIVRLDAGAGNGGNPTLAVGNYTQTAGSTQLAHDNGNFATLSSASPLQFQGGSLMGSGRLLGTVQVSGADTLVSPGYSIGQLNVQGTYAQNGGKVALEIGRTAAGAGGTVNDKLTSTTVLSLSNTAVSFSLLPGSLALQAGDTFVMLSSANNKLTLTGDSFAFDTSLSGYVFTQTQTAGAFTLTVMGAVPEPATWALFGLGALGLLGVGRRVRPVGPDQGRST